MVRCLRENLADVLAIDFVESHGRTRKDRFTEMPARVMLHASGITWPTRPRRPRRTSRPSADSRLPRSLSAAAERVCSNPATRRSSWPPVSASPVLLVAPAQGSAATAGALRTLVMTGSVGGSWDVVIDRQCKRRSRSWQRTASALVPTSFTDQTRPTTRSSPERTFATSGHEGAAAAPNTRCCAYRPPRRDERACPRWGRARCHPARRVARRQPSRTRPTPVLGPAPAGGSPSPHVTARDPRRGPSCPVSSSLLRFGR